MLGETVIVVRSAPGGRDRYGDPVDTLDVTRRDVEDCLIAPRREMSSESDTRDRQGLIVGLTVYAPLGADIVSTDRLEIRGELYEVDGLVGEWRDGTGFGGIEVNVRRATG